MSTGIARVRQRFRVNVLLFREIRTCFVGDRCTSGNCVGLRDTTQTLQVAFEDNGRFAAVRPDDPAVASAEVAQCVSLTLTSPDIAAIQQELNEMRENVRRWSGDAVLLYVGVRIVPAVDLALSRWGGGPYVAPWDIDHLADRYSWGRATDFTIVTHGVTDRDTGYHHDIGGCGGTYGADYGLVGAGYSWVPRTEGAFWFDCATQPVYTHEWLHQVHWDYDFLSHYDPIYPPYPPCGVFDPDTTRWFPDSHEWQQDPDYWACGQADPGGNDAVNSHIIQAHWPRDGKLVTNHCRNGVQDFGETEVDRGGSCPSR